MNWWQKDHFDRKYPFLQKRAALFHAVRHFFYIHGFIEVDTPALQICPVMDAHIHAFQTRHYTVGRQAEREMYLHTSPEFDMKKLLVAGVPKLYQLCHVYRNAEGSPLHLPEFTLLEWYRADADYRDIMGDCIALFRHVCDMLGRRELVYKGRVCRVHDEWRKLSVRDAFSLYADIVLDDVLDDREAFAVQARRIGVRVVDSDHWDDIFHAIMAEKIEPYLGFDQPCFLYDYPYCMAALSRACQDDVRYAERFELYICGVELANAFSELTDAAEQRKRYDDEMAMKRSLYGEAYPADEAFFAALADGLPDSGGIAVGIDRLLMLLCGVDDIRTVQWAPVQV